VPTLKTINVLMSIHIDMGKTTEFQKAQALQILDSGKIEELVPGLLYLVPSSRPMNPGHFVYYGTPRACNCEKYYYDSLKGIKFPIYSHIKAVGFFRGNQQ